LKFTGTALVRATGHHFVHEQVLRVAEKHAYTSRGSRGRFGHPWRPTPKGGGTGLAGVRALVLRCAWRTRDGGKVMLTTQRWRRSVCR
jgi:hypothetical protein